MHEKINYVEFPAADMAAVKAFFVAVFGWKFTDYGPGYSAFAKAEAGLDGGFYQAGLFASAADGGALIVFYSERLEETMEKITANGGVIIHKIFPFPGGRRFHFTDPCCNEYAVWSDKPAAS